MGPSRTAREKRRAPKDPCLQHETQNPSTVSSLDELRRRRTAKDGVDRGRCPPQLFRGLAFLSFPFNLLMQPSGCLAITGSEPQVRDVLAAPGSSPGRGREVGGSRGDDLASRSPVGVRTTQGWAGDRDTGTGGRSRNWTYGPGTVGED